MLLIPSQSETLILPISGDMAFYKLSKVTADYRALRKEDEEALFVGSVNDRAFSLSRKITSPINYIPILNGRVEQTRHGCIMFLEYSIFPAANMMLAFWSSILFLVCLFTAFNGMLLYALLVLCVGLLNYVLATRQFDKEIAISKEMLIEVLSLDTIAK